MLLRNKNAVIYGGGGAMARGSFLPAAHWHVAKTLPDARRSRELCDLRGLGPGQRNDRRHRQSDLWFAC